MQTFDYLVIGTGSAGLSFALEACSSGTVAVITKKERTESNTNYAQGGIAGALGAGDSPSDHLDDTLIAGAGLCKRDAVDLLVHEGPEAIRNLIAFGAQFSKESDGDLSLGREGGHSHRRIVRHADHTGREVEMTLVAQARHEPNIHVFEQIAAIDLIIDNSACLGAFALHEQTGEVEPFLAKATVIASGGCGQIYQHTTNPQIATGDGVAIAWRAGCKIANMEFIQFHPTALYAPGARCFLISEGVRGEGAVLRRKDGTAFMAEYDERKDLAPRDIVARAIDSEMKKGGVECVYLDITHKDAEWLKAHFPTIYSHCLTFGIDITTDWIPVVPAAHYSCGGVLTDLDGHTSIDRLYAAGEAACTGVHGANRLASNSLLEALVFGKRAALDAKKRIATLTNPYPAVIPDFVWPWPNHAEPQVSASEIKARIEAVMQKYVGIVRSNSRLAKAALAIEALKTDATGLFDNGRINVEKLEAYNMLDVASLVVESAKRRKESRGLHYTTDYPAPVDSENKDTILVKK